MFVRAWDACCCGEGKNHTLPRVPQSCPSRNQHSWCERKIFALSLLQEDIFDANALCGFDRASFSPFLASGNPEEQLLYNGPTFLAVLVLSMFIGAAAALISEKRFSLERSAICNKAEDTDEVKSENAEKSSKSHFL